LSDLAQQSEETRIEVAKGVVEELRGYKLASELLNSPPFHPPALICLSRKVE
jgi:hypothetical protein